MQALLYWSLLTVVALLGLSMPVFAGDSQRITIDLPLPRAALDSNVDPAASNGETLARLAPETSPRVPAVILPSTDSLEPRITQASPSGLKQLNLSLAEGQSLYLLFKRQRLNQTDLANMLNSSRRTRRLLSRLQPGQKFTVWVTKQKRVEKLVLETPGPTDMLLNRTPSGYELSKEPDSQAGPATQERRGSKEIPTAPAKATAGSDKQPARKLQVLVKSGDSLFLIFKRNNIPPRDLALLMSAKGSKALTRLRPGQRLDLELSPDSGLLALQMPIDETRSLQARRTAGGFRLTTKTQPLDRRISTAGATIESSLFLAGQRAGLSDPVIMQMAEIFGWDIDFNLEIRTGDRFTLIYEELYRKGKKIRDGRILAAEFFNRGQSFRALRYVDASGRLAYFSPKGLSMRKAFLRTPISFARISSRFNPRRKHPVLNRIIAHKGVDYAAPRGTPIKATGDGRVVFAGWKGGYGRTAIVQHSGKFSTLYAHMSRLNKRARKGKRVYQGQIIGYVGSTGLATGPNVHYEFRVNGVQKDSLKVKLPKALPIERQYKADFLAKSKPLIAHLNRLAATSLAGNP